MGVVGGGDEALEFLELCVTLRVGEGAGVEFDHVRAEGEGGVDLRGVRFDEHAHACAGFAESAHGRFEEGFEADDVESAFGGDFLTIFGDETGFVGACLEGDFDDFGCVAHFEVESQAGFSAEMFYVGVLDMATVGAEVDGDSDGTGGEALACGFENEGFGVVGERVFWVARLANGGDVIDVDAEVGHALGAGVECVFSVGSGECR